MHILCILSHFYPKFALPHAKGDEQNFSFFTTQACKTAVLTHAKGRANFEQKLSIALRRRTKPYVKKCERQ